MAVASIGTGSAKIFIFHAVLRGKLANCAPPPPEDLLSHQDQNARYAPAILT